MNYIHRVIFLDREHGTDLTRTPRQWWAAIRTHLVLRCFSQSPSRSPTQRSAMSAEPRVRNKIIPVAIVPVGLVLDIAAAWGATVRSRPQYSVPRYRMDRSTDHPSQYNAVHLSRDYRPHASPCPSRGSRGTSTGHRIGFDGSCCPLPWLVKRTIHI